MNRKIHVYAKGAHTVKWVYVWSTNAYRTCRKAVAAAKALHPNIDFTANFAKD